MTNSKVSSHSEWLSLIETSGPFLTLSMLEQVFPQGLETVETSTRQQLRAAYEEWREAVDQNDDLLPELHKEWVRLVLSVLLEYDSDSLVPATELHDAIPKVKSHDHSASFSPDLIIVSPTSREHRVFIAIVPPDTDLASAKQQDVWPLSLQERMTLLCRTYNIRLGFLTDGEMWMLVNAPFGSTSSQTTWYARLWFQEPITLKAFQSLLGVRRCFGPSQDTLESILDESLKHNEDVTETLGDQVKRAVEVLVQCLDKADQDRNRELLQDIQPSELYEAGLTVMMRLVFLLCAEERGLLLLGYPIYDSCYALTTLRGQLAEEADNHGPEVLDRRYDSWARMLALFRAVYGGIEHENLRMPALGGSLFDPDRFPFLEGRAKGTNWRESLSIPLPIDNRTVLLLLNSLQVLEQSGGALLLSYRTLDVEQIGHIYEGLLEYTVDRVQDVTIGLMGSQKSKNPYVRLTELESANQVSKTSLISLVKNVTLRSESAIAKGIAKPADEAMISRIQGVCGGDTCLSERIMPFANLIRTDAWDEPIIYLENSFMVTLGADRHETGTHYTPKSLTESIVSTTLEPIVYNGPAEGKNVEDWKLKPPGEILNLKICDPAMGSGAFLVQTCRYLGERMVEAWQVEERSGKAVTVDGDVLEHLGDAEPLPWQMDERLTIARRLIAERCLYGVDINPLAVELAKLSIWLVTLAKDRPFGFLDHNLRSGDSLLGIHKLDQLIQFRMNPIAEYDQINIFGQIIDDAVQDTIDLRLKLRTMPIRDVRDIAAMSRLDMEARTKLQPIELIADAMIGEALRCGDNNRDLQNSLSTLSVICGELLSGDTDNTADVCSLANESLCVDLPEGRSHRVPFHWATEFPEVFSQGGFDAVVGNPPFLGGKKVSGVLGSKYRTYLVEQIASGTKGVADLCVFFFLRTISLINHKGNLGLIVTSSLTEGDTREVGLDRLTSLGVQMYSACESRSWPGKASVTYCMIWITKSNWNGEILLNGHPVQGISPSLTASRGIDERPLPLKQNLKLSHIGSFIHGQGFVLSPEEAKAFIEKDKRNEEVLFPYLRGGDFATSPSLSPQAWVINFHDWSQEKATSYQELYEIVLKKVKPERDKVKRDVYRDKWWQYAEKQKTLYQTIEKLDRVLFHGFTTKYLAFGFVPATYVYAAPHVVIALDDYASFGLLQSGIHEAWVRRFTSYLGQTMRYIATDVFATFPFPCKMTTISEFGEKYYLHRHSLMLTAQIGLTEIYNRMNDQTMITPELTVLRELHKCLDVAVMKAYGWDDLVSLIENVSSYGFCETKFGTRWMMKPEITMIVVDRLLHVNHQRKVIV